jgi:hypothetical protein
MLSKAISLIIASCVALSSAAAQLRADQRAEVNLEISAGPRDSGREVYPANHRIKVAEGEYAIARIGDLGIQPPGTEEFEFGETWTLWATGDGEFEVQGEWRFDSPATLPNRIPFTLRLSRDLHPLSLKEFVRLEWQSDSGPLSCRLSPAELYCESGARDPKHMIVERVPMSRPYVFLWPISPFSLGSIAQTAVQHPDTDVEMTAVVAEEPSPVNPVCFVSYVGRVRYLGKEAILMDGRNILANKTALDPSPFPKLILWTDPQGLLLAVQRAEISGMRLELVKYRVEEDSAQP